MSLWGNKDQANNMPTYLNNNQPGNTNVYLINSNRIANSGAIGESVAHQGWVKVYPGKGSVKTITLNTSSLAAAKTYASANLIFTGSNTWPAKANVVISGTGTGTTATINIIDPGKEYTSELKITADATSEANNASLTFSYTGDGRLGRNLTETMVALSDIASVKVNSANTFFTD